VPDFFLFKELFADFSCNTAILANDLAPTNVNGPYRTSIKGFVSALQLPLSRR
jgi:hypothetical protein